MSPQATSGPEAGALAHGFDPQHFVPRPVPGVEILDRGGQYLADRYVLLRPGRDRTVLLSEAEKQLWELFDGRRTVATVCQDYLNRHRSLALARVYTLLRKLWEGGFLEDDPHLALSRAPRESRWSWVNALRLPLPGSAALVRLLGRALRPLALASRPVWLALLVLILLGLLAAVQLEGRPGLPFWRVAQDYLSPAAAPAPAAGSIEFARTDSRGELPAATPAGPEPAAAAPQPSFLGRHPYLAGLLLLLGLHLLASFLRETVAAAVGHALGARAAPVRLVLHLGLPAFAREGKWFTVLPGRARLAACFAGLAAELLAGGVCAGLLYLPLPPLARELAFKAMCLCYARSFFHLSPFAPGDLSSALALLSGVVPFRRKALGFLRHSLIDALHREGAFSNEQSCYLVYNLTGILWLGFAAKFGLDLVAGNQQAILDLQRQFAGEGLLSGLLLPLLLLPILACLLLALGAALYLFGKWALRQPLFERPHPVLALGLGLLLAILLVAGALTMFSQVATPSLNYLYNLLATLGMLAAICLLSPAVARTRGSVLGSKLRYLLTTPVIALLSLYVSLMTDWPTGAQVTIFAVLLVLLVAGFAYGLGHGQGLLHYAGTPRFLPELALVTGGTILGIGALNQLQPAFQAAFAAAPAAADGIWERLRDFLANGRLPPLNHASWFIGLGTYALGAVAQYLPLGRGLPTLPRVALPAAAQADAQTLRQHFLYIVHTLRQLIEPHLGRAALRRLERDVNRKLLPPAEFSFAAGCGLEGDADPGERARLYRRTLIRIYDSLVESCGQRLADTFFAAVLDSLHWESRQLLHQHLLDASPWESCYATEMEVGAERRLALLQAVSLFAGLAPADRLFLARHLVLRRYPAGELVVCQGDLAQACYILVSGQVQVEEQAPSGERRILAFLRGGDFFGESALLENRPRLASVRACVETQVLMLEHADFAAIAKAQPALGAAITQQVRHLQYLLRVPLFTDLPPSLLQALLPRLRTRVCRQGETVIRKGEIGHEFYLIKSGQVEVLAESGGAQERICELGIRDYFGEIALLQDIPRTATVRCLIPSELLVLSKDDFAQLLVGSEIFAQSLRAVGQARLLDIQN